MIMTGIWLFVMIAQAALRLVIGSQQCTGGIQTYNFDTDTTYITCPDGSIEDLTTTAQISYGVHSVLGVAFFAYIVIAVCHTRAAIRKKYHIQPSACGECDDCCFTFWCSCCAVSTDANMI
jgi:PLAC8 family